jgi:hypothetical protein
MIMGSAHTPERIMKLYKQMNLSQCSLNLVEIPKKCNSLVFSLIFEFCVKNHNMIPIAVYKRQTGEGNAANQGPGDGMNREDRNKKKPYVWLHPPKNTELSIHDELFVLCDKHPKDNMNAEGNMKGRDTGQA